MYCQKCGYEVKEGTKFCPICGQEQMAAQAGSAKNFSTPIYMAEQDTTEKKDSLAGSILTWGILSLAFSVSGCLAILGFIFSFIAKGKVKQYVELYGETEGRASVGKGLSKAGFIVGIIMTIYMILCFVFGIFFGLMSAL